jgi:hypothetical protein
MIEIYDSYSVYDILFDYAERNNCALIYFYNELYSSFDADKKQEILSYYEEFLPEDILLKIKNTNERIVKCETTDSAVMNATEWFPAVDYLPDSDYYWHCYVISPEGEFEYENIVIKPTPEEPAEGA